MHGSTHFQHGNSLFAVWTVVVNQANGFAFELVHTAGFGADVLDQYVNCGPVGTHQWEVPLEDAAVSRLAAAIAGCDEWNLVVRGFFG